MKPTDTEILWLMEQQRGSIMPTYYIKNCLQGQYAGLQTPWVLRRLKALEKAGYVERDTRQYATMICWRLPNRAAAQKAGDL
jgi:DNA-binding HxlR family transcriptional regulator